jgi:hypothetical protein
MTEKSAGRNPQPNKERVKLPRQRVPEQEPQVRAHNFQEVNLGFPPEQARQESLRCIECPKPGCIEKYPVSVNLTQVRHHCGDSSDFLTLWSDKCVCLQWPILKSQCSVDQPS